jgi:hypothetical protein
MEPSLAAVESNLVDLAGVSLGTLRSMESRVLAESLQELLPGIDHQLASVAGVDPGERFD